MQKGTSDLPRTDKFGGGHDLGGAALILQHVHAKCTWTCRGGLLKLLQGKGEGGRGLFSVTRVVVG